MDKHSLFWRYNKGTSEEYTEYYYYVLEAKLVLQEKIQVSIMTEFVENENREVEKQDCERTASKRLLKRLKEEFPMLRLCICGDSLYAYEGFLSDCRSKKWEYILRYKEGSIPSIYEEYHILKEQEQNRITEGEKEYGYVMGIAYREEYVNVAEYKEKKEKKSFLFLTSLKINKKNIKGTIQRGRWRWKIENEGFNTQKNHGYNLGHRYSHDYKGLKNHYLLIQIGHMISQVIESWRRIWNKVTQSREQKHKRLLESFKREQLKESQKEMERKIQLRFI